MRLWLLRLAAALIELFDGALPAPLKLAARRMVRAAERDLEILLYLMAARLMSVPVRAPTQPRRPRSVRAGFGLRLARGMPLRSVTHGVFQRTGTLAQRIQRMMRVLADPTRAIARILKRVARGLIGARLVTVAPPALSFASGMPAPRAAFADSS